MKIDYLKLINYRNYEDLEINFSNNLNIIYGNNGSGKSNIVESIYFLSLTKSFRTSNDNHLLKIGTDSGKVIGKVSTKVSTKYEINMFRDEQKKVFIDNNKTLKLSDYVGRINIVLFNPLDTKVISDGPINRRKLLNIEISQINNEYLLLLNDYNKILKHRNAYLKQLYLNGNASREYLDILTRKLVEYGLKIYNIRHDYINKLNNNISKIYKNIFETGELIVKYKSTYSKNDVDKIMDVYKKNYRKEMALGKSITGVHHDDIEFILDGEVIKEYGSVGQQKNAIISFKLAELLIIKEIKGYYPILILDDLFSELDDQKINNIINMLDKEVQTFITTTNIDKVDKKLLTNSTVFKIENNMIERNDL